MSFKTDQILWYNNGAWGQLGYAVPNFGDNPNSLNAPITSLVSSMGRVLSSVMHHSDADLRVPPSINTIIRVDRLCKRIRQILASRAVAPNQTRFEATHSTPAPQDFLVFPVPYFRVRNAWLKEWCALVLNAISEAMQHTDNRLSYEITTDFASRVGQYVQRVYQLMATELFQVPVDQARAADFSLTDEQLNAYNPAAFFTSTELIDTVRPAASIPTEDDLVVLTDGIPASTVLGLMPWPAGAGTSAPNAAPNAAPAAAPAGASFPSAPAP